MKRGFRVVTGFCMSVVLSCTIGCSGSDRHSTDAHSEVALDSWMDVAWDEGGESPDATTDYEMPQSTCTYGENPDGNGCLIPCSDGWHPGNDGSCHLDCPSAVSEDDEGVCSRPACPVGWYPTDVYTEPAGDGLFLGASCLMECPGTMNPGENLAHEPCILPCPEGFSEDPEVGCYLDCREGMLQSQTLSGCELVEVGESKECPGGKYDTSFNGPGPLYVDANSQSELEDGSLDHPFRSIQKALNAAASEVTVYVAPGEYQEWVYAQNGKEINLIGACAEKVSLHSGAPISSPYPGAGAVSLINIQSVRIRGIAIESGGSGIDIEHFGTGEYAEIRDVRIAKTGSMGIGVLGKYPQVLISGNTVYRPTEWGIRIHGDLDNMEPVDGEVVIERNHVTEVQTCDGNYCIFPDVSIHRGIGVFLRKQSLVRANHVSDFEHAEGIIHGDVELAEVRGNIVENLTGVYGISFGGGPPALVKGTSQIHDNRIVDGNAGSHAGNPAWAFTGIMAVAKKGTELEIHSSGNFLSGLQGCGLSSIGASMDERVDFAVRRTQIQNSACGFRLMVPGKADLEQNWFTSVMIQGISFAETSMNENDFSNGLSGFEMPENEFSEWLESENRSLGIICMETDCGAKDAVSIHGNRFHNLPAVDESDWRTLEFIMKGLSLKNNVFSDNDSPFLIDGIATTVDIQGNWFQAGEMNPDELRVALKTRAGNEGDPTTSVHVADNLFRWFQSGAGVWLKYYDGAGLLTVTRNRFHGGSVVLAAIGGGSGAQAEVSGNDLMLGAFDIDSFNSLEVVDNRVSLGFLKLEELSGLSSTEIQGNLFHQGEIRLLSLEGAVAVTNNALLDSSGYGLLVLDSTAEIQIEHNLFNSISSDDYDLAGTVGDAIHVSGTESEPVSNVRIRDNRIAGADRLGILASSATCEVENNMFHLNGDDCGGECDLAIQFEPGEEAVTGSDVEFAVRPESPYGALTLDIL